MEWVMGGEQLRLALYFFSSSLLPSFLPSLGLSFLPSLPSIFLYFFFGVRVVVGP